MQGVEMESTIQVKTYKIKSQTGVPSTLKLCWSRWPLPDDLFPTFMGQHLWMGCFYACWRFVDHE